MFRLKIRHVLLFGMFLSSMFCCRIVAQYPHHLLLWGGVGYAGLTNDVADMHNVGGLGTDLGIGYEWQHKKLLLHTGVGFQYFGPAWKKDNFIFEQDRVDSESQVYTARYYFQENRERIHLGYINIPLMIGMNIKRFYFLAGGKVGLNVYGKSRMDNVTVSTGDYGEFIDDFENMPNHGFDEYVFESDYPVSLNVNLALGAEAGITFKPEETDSRLSYRVALWGDYGVLNVQNKTYNEELLWMTDNSFPMLNSLIRTAGSAVVHPLSFGLKLTLVWGFEGRRPCMCDWY